MPGPSAPSAGNDFHKSAEFYFESGVAEILSRVRVLIGQQKYVVISISGSDNQVGKTTLTTRIARELKADNVAVAIAPSVNDLEDPKYLAMLEREATVGAREGGKVIILQADLLQDIFESMDLAVRMRSHYAHLFGEVARRAHLPFDRADITVLIGPTDEFPPDRHCSTDIVIRNDQLSA